MPSTAERPRGIRGVRRLFEPIEIAPLVYFRILFGTIMLWEAWRYVTHGWVRSYLIAPRHHFQYYPFEWVHPWPGNGMYVHFFVMGALAVFIILGAWYRLAAAAFFVLFTHFFLIEQAIYLNHLYLVCLVAFLMILVPAHRAFSIDAAADPHIRSRTAPAWSLWLLRAQIGLVYFYGGVAKLNRDWLMGEPMRDWLAGSSDLPIVGPWLPNEFSVAFFTYGGLLLDLFIVPALLWRRTVLWALIPLISFHLLNFMLFDIGIFPWLMLATTPLFFPFDWWRAFRERLEARLSRSLPSLAKRLSKPETTPLQTPAVSHPGEKLSWTQRGVLGFLAMWMGIQVLMPLRHWLYSGDVNWTEEGHRFSWHMKLRDKQASARFFVTDKATGQTEEIDPYEYIISRQYRKMSTRPDMVLQMAHIVRDEYRARGKDVEVRADVQASLNGRKTQPLVDPTVDLAAQPRNLWPATWIVPLYEPLQTGWRRPRPPPDATDE